MVIKGSARGGAGSLAAHLVRTDHNERLELGEFRGVSATDVREALREMESMVQTADSRRRFYHASINTPAGEALSATEATRSRERLAAEMGLSGQPFIEVDHVKHGRLHRHVVWLRIDPETLKAIPDSHNYRRHEIVARELEREFGHQRVQGAHIERDGIERPKRTPSLAEMMQAGRSGISPEDAKTRLRDLWGAADNGRSFAAALDDAGWTLARGDKRGFVALDPTGEVRSVNKDITGLTAAKVRERLADIDLDQLPSVDQARQAQRERQRERDQAAEMTPEPTRQAELEPQSTPAPEPVTELRPDPEPPPDPARPLELAPELRQEAHREPEAVAGRVVAPPEPEAIQQPEKRPSWLRRVWDGLFGRQRQAEPVAAPPPEPIRESLTPEPEWAKGREKSPTELFLEQQRAKPEPEDVLEMVKRRVAERQAQEAERLAAMTPEQRAEHERQEVARKEREYGRGRSLFPDYSRGRTMDGPGF